MRREKQHIHWHQSIWKIIPRRVEGDTFNLMAWSCNHDPAPRGCGFANHKQCPERRRRVEGRCPRSTISTDRGEQVREAKGNTLVEFALLLPILILILMGIFDLGRAFYAHNVITNAAREGARYGVAHPDGSVQAVEDAAEGFIVGLDPDELTIAATCSSSETVRVEITYDFYVVTPLMAQFLSGQDHITLTSVATMYVEGTCDLQGG